MTSRVTIAGDDGEKSANRCQLAEKTTMLSWDLYLLEHHTQAADARPLEPHGAVLGRSGEYRAGAVDPEFEHPRRRLQRQRRVGRARQRRRVGGRAGGREIHDEGPNFTYTFPNFTLGAAGRVKLHTGGGANAATDLYWRQGGHVWNNTRTENAYLVDTGGRRSARKSCR